MLINYLIKKNENIRNYNLFYLELILILCKLFLAIIKLLFYNVELVVLTKFKELLQ